MTARMSYSEVNAHYEVQLQLNGTDVEQNEADPYGDGDQSRIPADREHQFYRDMFAEGGDINQLMDMYLAPLSTFAKQCIGGQADLVRVTLEELAGKDQDKTEQPSLELIHLLEKRETALRLSPLLMVVSLGKNVSASFGSRHEEVAELLLHYGARPDARDVCGKTVCHYGMGAMATKMTLSVVNMCIKAYESSRFFGKQVELHSLKTAAMNGMQGWCKGYVWQTHRRAVTIHRQTTDKLETIGIKPENLKLVVEDSKSTVPVVKLFDIPDRLGAVCLLEVIMANRMDVAKILLKKHKANLDVTDADGVSPRSMSVRGAMLSPVASMVNQAAGKSTKQTVDESYRTCSNCSKKEAPDSPLLSCKRCHQTQYCGEVCQLEHWKKGGHKKVCKALAAKQTVAIALDKPKGGMFYSTVSLNHKTRFQNSDSRDEASGYTKPRGVDIDEKFDLKVQGNGNDCPLMIYDKSRECNFKIDPGDAGFDELLQAVRAEPTWQGRKTFVAASFDDRGVCTVYPGLTSIHKW